MPYEIEWKEFTSGPPLLEALNAGAIHVGGVGNTPPLFAAAAKGEFQAVQAATYGGTGRRDRRPEGLRHQVRRGPRRARRSAVAEGSSANYNLLAQLDEAGLTYGDVEVENLQPADALAAFSAGHVDAWAIWEPYTSQAEHEADARVITDRQGRSSTATSSRSPPTRRSTTRPPTAALEDYVARIARAQVWSQTHKEEWAKVWAEETGPERGHHPAAAPRSATIELVPIDQR